MLLLQVVEELASVDDIIHYKVQLVWYLEGIVQIHKEEMNQFSVRYSSLFSYVPIPHLSIMFFLFKTFHGVNFARILLSALVIPKNTIKKNIFVFDGTFPKLPFPITVSKIKFL
jgi:hypothetical protein